ncbi:hypothetical protein ACFXO7_04800, partial [Nocardia tengchongensis]|uniref:hypothetical protein n=1 Tax=Nocardia tengchongensis TaxID=2055889 RepID=UPI0036AB4A57
MTSGVVVVGRAGTPNPSRAGADVVGAGVVVGEPPVVDTGGVAVVVGGRGAGSGAGAAPHPTPRPHRTPQTDQVRSPQIQWGTGN